MWHPWRRLRELSHVGLEWQDVNDELGHVDHDPPVVTITLGMTQAERRSTLTHELIHLERGVAGPRWKAREERAVDDLAARRLIPLDALIDALLWSQDHQELAEQLWVDIPTLRTRLDRLTPAERRIVEAEVDRREAQIP